MGDKRKEKKRHRRPVEPKTAKNEALRSRPGLWIAAIAGIALVVAIALMFRQGCRTEESTQKTTDDIGDSAAVEKQELPQEVLPTAQPRLLVVKQAPYPPTDPNLTIDQENELVIMLKNEELSLAKVMLEMFPDDAEAVDLIGNVYRNHGSATKALEAWKHALQIDPQLVHVYGEIAAIANEKGQYADAIEAWKKALALDPEQPLANARVAQALMDMGQYEEALPYIAKELKRSPQSVLCLFLSGEVHFKLKEYAKAKDYYHKVIEIDPKHTNAYYGLFNSYSRLKQRDLAKKYMATFKKLSDEDIDSLEDRYRVQMTDMIVIPQNVARTYVFAEKLIRRTGDVQRIEALLKRANTLDPSNKASLERLAGLYQLIKRPDEAMKLTEKLLELDPDNGIYMRNLGVLAVETRRFARAEDVFKKLIELAPNHSQGYYELARLYLRNKDKFSDALPLAEKALQLDKRPENYFIVGWARDVNGDRMGALIAMEQAVKLAPENKKYQQLYTHLKNR